MFSGQHQNGDTGVEIYSASGSGRSNSAAPGQPTASGIRDYERAIKGYCLRIEKTATLRLPPAPSRESLGIIQPILILQIFNLAIPTSCSVEIVITTKNGQKKRMHISTAFRDVECNDLHAQLPWVPLVREKWCNCVINLHNISIGLFRQEFLGIDSILLKSTCYIRKIFTMPISAIGKDATLSIPPSFQFLPGVTYRCYFLGEHYDESKAEEVSNAPILMVSGRSTAPIAQTTNTTTPATPADKLSLLKKSIGQTNKSRPFRTPSPQVSQRSMTPSESTPPRGVPIAPQSSSRLQRHQDVSPWDHIDDHNTLPQTELPKAPPVMSASKTLMQSGKRAMMKDVSIGIGESMLRNDDLSSLPIRENAVTNEVSMPTSRTNTPHSHSNDDFLRPPMPPTGVTYLEYQSPSKASMEIRNSPQRYHKPLKSPEQVSYLYEPQEVQEEPINFSMLDNLNHTDICEITRIDIDHNHCDETHSKDMYSNMQTIVENENNHNESTEEHNIAVKMESPPKTIMMNEKNASLGLDLTEVTDNCDNSDALSGANLVTTIFSGKLRQDNLAYINTILDQQEGHEVSFMGSDKKIVESIAKLNQMVSLYRGLYGDTAAMQYLQRL